MLQTIRVIKADFHPMLRVGQEFKIDLRRDVEYIEGISGCEKYYWVMGRRMHSSRFKIVEN
jgi:hypothetical protein